METNGKYIDRSYKVSQLILVLLTFAAFSVVVNINPQVSRYLFGLPIIISGLLGIYGSVFILKGIDEPISEKKIVSITVNFEMVLLILTIFISNTLYN